MIAQHSLEVEGGNRRKSKASVQIVGLPKASWHSSSFVQAKKDFLRAKRRAQDADRVDSYYQSFSDMYKNREAINYAESRAVARRICRRGDIVVRKESSIGKKQIHGVGNELSAGNELSTDLVYCKFPIMTANLRGNESQSAEPANLDDKALKKLFLSDYD
jgi:hypothetical protein